MLRVVAGISILALLMVSYLVNPIIGWFGLGTVLLMFVFLKRTRQMAAANAREDLSARSR